MYKRFDLDVYHLSTRIYSCSFSSLNLAVKIAAGFDKDSCDFECHDVVLEKPVPIEEYCEIYRGDINGI